MNATRENPILTITSEVRGGGYGGSAWIAKITGPDPKYGLARDFVQSERNVSRSGKSGTVRFSIYEPGIYEVRSVQLPAGQATIGQLWNGFIEVNPDGSYKNVSKPVFQEAQ